MEQTVARIPLTQIVPNPNQPRKEFDEEGLQQLARSIATAGVKQPIVVRPNGCGYEVVMGERRWRASQIAGKETIPAIVEQMDDETMALLALAENVCRQDLNVAEQGNHLKRLLDGGMPWEAIEATVGMERQYLEWKVEVVDKCRPEVVWLIKQGTLTGNTGWRLSKLSWNGQMRFLREVQQRPMTVQEQIGLTEAIWAGENQGEMFEELKLTEEQQAAAKAFRSVIDLAIRAAEKLERMDDEKPGTVGTAMATELDVSVQKIGQLVQRLSAIKRSLERLQGRMAARA